MRTKALLGTMLLGLSLAGGRGGAQVIDHSNPASGNDDLVANQSYAWGPLFLGGICRLTDKGSSETSSIFSRNRVNVGQFETSFVFQILNGGPGDASDGLGDSADGITFTIQAQGIDALGAAGGSLGYEGIGRSVCVKFDTVPNDGDPSVSSTGLFRNGEGPFGGIDLMKDGIKLRSQRPFRVDMRYNGRVLAVRITDTVTGGSARQTYAIDIPRTIGSRTAHVGFTAATGLGTSAQDLLKWYWASPPLVARSDARRARFRTAVVAATATGEPVTAWPLGPAPRVKSPFSRAARAVAPVRRARRSSSEPAASSRGGTG